MELKDIFKVLFNKYKKGILYAILGFILLCFLLGFQMNFANKTDSKIFNFNTLLNVLLLGLVGYLYFKQGNNDNK